MRICGQNGEYKYNKMTTPHTITMVQDSTKCVEGLHMMHIGHAMHVGGAIRPKHLAQRSILGDQNRWLSAPNQLN